MAERAPRPALMIIGEVVALRDELRWFSEGLIETAVKAA
jgi:uroporphyrin-III C-methyltransferase/precorrin-2 dehydrogenase/sirohydrochlorin ferrochelatase